MPQTLKRLQLFDLATRLFLWGFLGFQIWQGDIRAGILLIMILIWVMLYDIRQELREGRE